MSLAPEPSLPPLVAERPQDAAGVERLLLRAFGPGRYAKAAERLRDGRDPLRPLSFVAWEDGQIVGCVRQWAVTVGETPAILLGPFAVDPDFRRQGLGAALIEQACAAAANAGHGLIVLVGDAPYFGPLGFVAAPKAVMPGPVDQRRVLVRVLNPSAADAQGAVAAA
jgi:predicted N-acetyltransferase YhbS